MKRSLAFLALSLAFLCPSRGEEIFEGKTPVTAGALDLATDRLLVYDASTGLLVNATPAVLLTDAAGTYFLSPAATAAAYQPLDADLTLWAGYTPTANGGALVSAANYAAMRALLDLEEGTDFLSVAAIAAAYQGLDADLTDLADGTLTGSKVGTGISGDNITSGTVADARIASTITRDGEAITGSVAAGTVVASGFNGNLATTDDTVQEIAQKLDDLSTGGGGGLTSTDLAGGTALSINVWYYDTLSADRTFDALPAGTNGDQIIITFDVTGSARTVNYHTNSTVYRVGESGAVTSAISFPVGNHTLKLNKADGKWWLTDSGSLAETYAASAVTVTDAAGLFAATTVEDALLESSKIVTKSTAAAYTIGTTNPRELYGGVIYVTAAATLTIPAVAPGASFTVVTIGSVAVSVDPAAADLINLDGTALADGDKVTNGSTAGDIAVFTYLDATGWYCSSNGWTDGN